MELQVGVEDHPTTEVEGLAQGEIDDVLKPRARDIFEAVDWVQLEFSRDAEGGTSGFELKTERATGLIFTRQEAWLEELDGRGWAAADVEGSLGRP